MRIKITERAANILNDLLGLQGICPNMWIIGMVMAIIMGMAMLFFYGGQDDALGNIDDKRPIRRQTLYNALRPSLHFRAGIQK